MKSLKTRPLRKEQLKRFKKLFEEKRKNALFNNRVLQEEFSVNADDRPDELDQATTDIHQSMRMRLCNREVLLIKKIDNARYASLIAKLGLRK